MPIQQMLLGIGEPHDTTPYYKVTQNNISGHGCYIDLGANIFPSGSHLTYTVEVWCRPLVDPTNGEAWVVDQHPGGSGRLIIGGSSGGSVGHFAGNGWYSGNNTSFGNTTDWAHLAWVANGDGSVTMFKNGFSVGTSGTNQITAAPDNKNTLWGQDTPYGGTGSEYRGFRINSNALYSVSNFTPPTAALTNISGTVLLCCQDSSSTTTAAVSSGSVNSNGNPTAQSESVNGFTTGTIDFDGSGDYLHTSHSNDYDFGSGDFTVEAWIRPTNNQQTDPSMVALWNFPQGRRSWGIFGNTGGSPATYNGAVRGTVSPDGQFATRTEILGTLTINSWNHVAFVRNGNTLDFFINGVSQGTATYTGSVYNNTQDGVMVGAMGNPSDPRNDFNGKISNVRVIKGTALYTSNFTPPDIKGGLTNISGTKALWDGLTGSATDASGNNTWSVNNMTFSLV